MAHGQAFRIGAEFQANTLANSADPEPVVVASPSGDSFVVWTQSGPSHGIFGRRFDSAGVAIGSQFQINAVTAAVATSPAVAPGVGGGFIVVWSGTAGAAPAAFARRFSSAGTGLGSEFRVDSYALGPGASDPDVAADADGNFLVAWSDLGINGRRFASSGAPLGSQFRISAQLTSDATEPDVAADGAGNFVVVWLESDLAIVGRRFDGNGAALGSEFEVESVPYIEDAPAIEVDVPVVAADTAGNFVVGWERYEEAASDFGSSRSDVFVRAFDGAGHPRSGGFQISSSPHYNYNPSIAAFASDGFVVVWDGYQYDASAVNVYAQRFGADGDPIGAGLLINATLPDYQANPSVGASGDDAFAVVWSDYAAASFAPDVRGQRFATKLSSPVCSGGAIAGESLVKLSRLAAPAGDESLQMKGTFLLPPGTPAVFDPSNAGAQILVEDLGRGTVLFELSHRTHAVPGGGGCATGDGWKTNGSGSSHSYRNGSGALPPGCTAGSAKGLGSIKLKDRRERSGEITFKLKVKRASIAAPVGPLRATIVFGAGATESNAGECGVVSFAAEQCSPSGSSYRCQTNP